MNAPSEHQGNEVAQTTRMHRFRSVCEQLPEKQERDYYIRNVPISAQVLWKELATPPRHFMPFTAGVYVIHLEHGPHRWTVQRRFRDFFLLHNHVLLSRAKRNLLPYKRRPVAALADFDAKDVVSSPTNSTMSGEESVADQLVHCDDQRTSEPARKPIKMFTLRHQSCTSSSSSSSSSSSDDSDSLASFPVWDNIFHVENSRNSDKLGIYLNSLLQNAVCRNFKETREFIEISKFSFVSGLGMKRKEGLLKKRPGGRVVYSGMFHCCKRLFFSWRYRWFFLKDSYLAYADPEHEDVRAVMLFDPGFHVALNNQERRRPRLVIENMSRTLVVECKTKEQAFDWYQEMQNTLMSVGSPWLQSNAHGSTFPLRHNSHAMWFVDGKSYMETLANMIELAEEEVFITGWWLSPEIYLKRPATEGQRWRLDEVLKRSAERGVRVYVLLYKEVEMALGINSLYSKQTLKKLHPNIKVIRHPDHIPGRGIILWAHHEKLVIVDQNIAFIGGIDLCYGRWDDDEHRLVDFGSVSFAPSSSLQCAAATDKSVLSAFRSMSRMVPLVNMRSDSKENTEKSAKRESILSNSKMVQEHFKRGPQRLSNARFNLHQFTDVVMKFTKRPEAKVEMDNKPEANARRRLSFFPVVHPWSRLRRALHEGAWKVEEVDEAAKCYEDKLTNLQQEDSCDSGLMGGGKYWIGKDYVNFVFKDFTEIDLPYNDFIDRRRTPRMPWHDIACVVFSTAARDASRHFIERWNACKTEKCKFDSSIPYLVPKSYQRVQLPQLFQRIAFRCNVQLLRSSCQWSAGHNRVEDSIHRAYVFHIENAKHYIYIENQFFITMLFRYEVQNSVAKALLDRILKAHRNKETFRVYVLLPLLPAFEGQLGTTGGNALQAVLYWTYMSLCKGANSLMVHLQEEIPDPSEYIVFCSLRTHGKLMEKMVTELLYIHSKLMIVDDLVTIIGSANINDRSLLGKRDSEVALLIEDTDHIASKMNAQEYMSGSFAHSLRLHLFAEHLGLNKEGASPIDISDPASEQFFSLWKGIARKNTDIYERVFCCIPTDEVETFEELKKYKSRLPLFEYDSESAEALLNNLTGNLVFFPMKFLTNSDLAPSYMTKEGLAPTILFT